MDKEKIEAGVKLILEGIGENPDREGLLDTPDRIARMYEEIFGGLTQTAEEPLSKTFHVKDNAMVLEKDITFYSTCEHHFMPFYGKAHIAYIPDGKVVGLSNGHAGGRAYVHDDAGGEEAWEQNRNICDARCF